MYLSSILFNHYLKLQVYPEYVVFNGSSAVLMITDFGMWIPNSGPTSMPFSRSPKSATV
jgi:hypothetical protein